ncbi:hypothetical protein PCK1_001451 [Pneumocystis canis]|nr:hypothetical protein PCK1_001451 [Pneumocystis canis]
MTFHIRRFKTKSTKILTENEEEEDYNVSSLFFSEKKGSPDQKTPFHKIDHIDESSKSTKTSEKKKEFSSLRLSFGDQEDNQDDNVFINKKLTLNPEIQQKKKKSPLFLIKIPDLTEKTSETTPKYNPEYLSELRSSTPSTPKEFCNIYKESIDASDLSITQNSPHFDKVPKILEDGIVKALKERRIEKARRSKLNDSFIPLEDDNQLVSYSQSSESRLQHEDDLFGDDGTEGIQEYIDDPIILDKNLEKAQIIQKRIEIKDAIEEVENMNIEEEFSSEEESRRWEQTQIRKGVYGPKFANTDLPQQKKHQKIITKVPDFKDSIKRLKNELFSIKSKRETMLSEIKILISEKEDILKREIEIKESLQKASQEYSNLYTEISQINSPIRGLDSIASYSTKQTSLSQTIS